VSEKKLARIELVADRTASSRCDEGFLRLRRLRLKNHYADGSTSREYSCDVVSRPGADAVAVVLWHKEGRKVFVHLRLGTRAAVYLRRDKKAELIQPDERVYDTLLELVAGILERDDTGPGGLARRAAAEAHEEAGFEIGAGAVRILGSGFFPTPGVTDEKVFLTEAEVDPRSAGAIHGDGSVMEEGASVVVRELRDAISACRRGEIVDVKTEVGLLRIADVLGYIPQLDAFVDELPAELKARFKPLGLESFPRA
jgi:ADP-ribose pyrophosphatase